MSLHQPHWKKIVGRFLLAQTVSLLGSSLVQYAIVWYITLSTSSGLYLTLSTLCGFIPQILVSLFAGTLLDRFDRKRVIMIADGVIALSTLLLAVAFLSGMKSLWLLFAVLAIRSAGTGIQTPAVQSLLPQMVPKEHLMRINGIHSTLSSLTMFLSPALSGLILSVSTLEATLLIDVVTAVIGIGITAKLAIAPYRREKSDTSALSDIKQGFSYLKGNHFVRNLLVFQFAILFLISPSAFLTPLMVSRSFGPEVWRLTASEMTYSVGSILGGLLIGRWGGFSNRMSTAIAAAFAYGVCMLGLGSAPVFWMYLAVNTLIGITSPCYNTPLTTAVQENVDPAMHGRVFSFVQIAGSCALPLGMALFGPLADRVAIPVLLWCAGGLVILCTGVMLWRTRRQERRGAAQQ